LLKMLRVPNCPSDFRHVRSLICKPYNTMIFREIMVSCPSCHKISTDTTHCSTTPNCVNKDKFISNPTINHILQVEPQIRSILERNHLMIPNNNENLVRDIIDAPFYRKLLHAESEPFITLLMNSDGAVVKSISRSVWITTFVINELPSSVRFNRENVIIAMVSMGSVKPNKNEMQIFLERLVQELLYIERYGLQYTPFSSSTPTEKLVHVFLIAAVCDKPAASLLINHTEAGGYFGCIHFTLTRLIHNGNTPTIELLRNIDLLQQTWLSLSDVLVPPELKLFDQQINSSMRQAVPSNLLYSHRKTIRFHKKILLSSLAPDVADFVIKCVAQRPFKLFKTVFFNQQRLSSDPIDTPEKTNDGCVMYRRNDVPSIGFLETIISFDNCREPVFVIRPVVLISSADSMRLNNRIFKCTNVLYGTCDETTLETTTLKCIVQKLAFRPGNDIKFHSVCNSMFFFQYPNLSGST
ncbi:unnamed protein product, partial [Rotaria sp. Silwood2]